MSSASDLVEGRAWTAHTASVSRECFQYSSLSVFGPCFSSEFVRVRVFSDCCFSCLSLGTCDAHIFISSHDRSSTLCSTYTHVHRSTTCCLVGRIVPLNTPPLRGERGFHPGNHTPSSGRVKHTPPPSPGTRLTASLSTSSATPETLNVAASVVHHPLREKMPCLPRTPMPPCSTFHQSPAPPRPVGTVRSPPTLRTWPLCPGELVAVRLR